jgi:hypothetical protein
VLLGNVEFQHRHAAQLNTHANAYCERLVGSIRREYLDFMIPLGEKHLRRILAECVLDPHIIISQRVAGECSKPEPGL